MIDFFGGGGIRAAPHTIHKVVIGITTQPHFMAKNIVKKIITELWVIAYVHLYATPVAIVSFGFVATMMMFTWILLNGF